MTEITEYNVSTKHNTQEELQRLAKEIFAFGKITKTNHFVYTTTNSKQNGSYENPEIINYGGVCYEVEAEGFPVKFYIHISGFTVMNI